MNNKIVVFILFFFASCNLGVDDKALSGGYNYEVSNHNHRLLSPYPLDQNIYGDIIDFDYNDEFIVAFQEPSRGDYSENIAALFRIKTKQTDITDAVLSESKHYADSVLNTEMYRDIFKNDVNYWVISHKEKKTYGPLNKKAYIEIKKKLNISNSVKLKFE